MAKKAKRVWVIKEENGSRYLQAGDGLWGAWSDDINEAMWFMTRSAALVVSCDEPIIRAEIYKEMVEVEKIREV